MKHTFKCRNGFIIFDIKKDNFNTALQTECQMNLNFE